MLDVKRRDIWNAYEKTLYVNADGSGGCTPAKGSPCFVVNAGAPVPIKTATEAQVAYVLERRSRFPGVQFLETTQRQYPFHDLAPNVLGYTGQINSTELKMEKFANQQPGDVIGQAGVEYSYDADLRGLDGVLEQNYDAAGRAVGKAYLQKAAQPGDTLRLTIDYRLQKVAQKAIGYGIQVAHNDGETGAHVGAIVAMNPNTGEILAHGVVPELRPVRVPAAGQGAPAGSTRTPTTSR